MSIANADGIVEALEQGFAEIFREHYRLSTRWIALQRIEVSVLMDARFRSFSIKEQMLRNKRTESAFIH